MCAALSTPASGASSAAFESGWVPLNRGRVFTRSGGTRGSERTPLVLLHGFVLASEYMMPLARALAPYAHVWLLDLPGYGRSEKRRAAMTLPGLADALAEWMEALNLRRAHFVGNSFGCQVLVEFAVRHATRVERLVLQGPTVDPRARTIMKQIARLVQNSRVESPGLGRLMRRDYWRAGLRGIVATARMALADRVERKLSDIRAPVLIVRGARDVLVTQEWAERMVRLLPDGRLVVLPELAHTINYTAPRALARVVRDFVSL